MEDVTGPDSLARPSPTSPLFPSRRGAAWRVASHTAIDGASDTSSGLLLPAHVPIGRPSAAFGNYRQRIGSDRVPRRDCFHQTITFSSRLLSSSSEFRTGQSASSFIRLSRWCGAEVGESMGRLFLIGPIFRTGGSEMGDNGRAMGAEAPQLPPACQLIGIAGQTAIWKFIFYFIFLPVGYWAGGSKRYASNNTIRQSLARKKIRNKDRGKIFISRFILFYSFY